MDRRAFVIGLGAVLAAPLDIEAQQGKSFKVGFLLTDQYGRQAFVSGLNELGYVEGKNLTLVRRYTEGRRDQLPNLAAEAVGLTLDVIFVTTGYQVAAVAKLTKTIPIVAIAGDLAAEGLVGSLSRPGGNITGLQLLQPDAAAKRLALLKESVPGLARVGVFFGAVGQWFYDRVTQETQAAAQTLRLQVQIVRARAAAEVDSVFGALANGRAEALMLTADALTIANRERLATLAVKHRW